VVGVDPEAHAGGVGHVSIFERGVFKGGGKFNRNLKGDSYMVYCTLSQCLSIERMDRVYSVRVIKVLRKANRNSLGQVPGGSGGFRHFAFKATALLAPGNAPLIGKQSRPTTVTVAPQS